MKSLTLSILALFFVFLNTNAQTSLTKDEIINSWKSETGGPRTIRGYLNFTFDAKTSKKINLFIENLKNNGVDSFIIYSILYPGSLTTDTCNDYMYPIYSYILWPSSKKINIKTINGKCEFISTIADSLNIFEFYRNNQNLIRSETIMPVIFSAQKTTKNKITYEAEFIDHEPKYSLCFIAKSFFKGVYFTQNDIENIKSLFHNHNLSLKSVELWKLIDKKVRSGQN